MNESLPLRASTPAELLELVPYLLGFHPRESLVLICLRRGSVVLTVRVDLDAADDIDATGAMLAQLQTRTRMDQLLAIVYSSDRDSAERVVDMVHCACCVDLLDQLWVRDTSWRSLLWPDASGTVDPCGRLAAAAVVAGLAAASTREELVASVSRRCDAPPLERELAASRRRTRRLALDRRRQRLRRMLAGARSAPLSDSQLAELLALIEHPQVRDVALFALSRDTAPDELRVWLDIVGRCDDTQAHLALGFLGIAAWLAGEGALAVAALERAESAAVTSSLLELLDSIVRGAVPPTWWDEVREQIVA